MNMNESQAGCHGDTEITDAGERHTNPSLCLGVPVATVLTLNGWIFS